jgi:hypothetical protein
VGEVRYVAWHLHGKPLPEGARLVSGPVIDSHHRHYASLIEWIDDDYGLGAR